MEEHMFKVVLAVLLVGLGCGGAALIYNFVIADSANSEPEHTVRQYVEMSRTGNKKGLGNLVHITPREKTQEIEATDKFVIRSADPDEPKRIWILEEFPNLIKSTDKIIRGIERHRVDDDSAVMLVSLGRSNGNDTFKWAFYLVRERNEWKISDIDTGGSIYVP